jgi:hypothetical protein
VIRKTLETKLLLGLLAVLFVASILTSIFNVDAKWQTPLIFLALIAILRLLTPVDEIHTDVRYLRELSSSAKISPFPTIDAFYADLRHALSKATYSLDLTHIRDNPPQDFGEHASGWFEAVLEWLSKDSARSARRLISVRNEGMRTWAAELQRASSQVSRLQVRVVDWSVDAPAINMAIVDANVVFLAVTGELLERTRGIAVEDHAVASYFTDYYNNLWHAAVPLDEFLSRAAPRMPRRAESH